MPFRRFFEARGAKHPVAYSNATLALGVLVCMFIAIMVAVNMNNRAIARERAAQDQARRASCMLITQINNAYREDPPTTPAGKNVAEAWARVEIVFQCEKR